MQQEMMNMDLKKEIGEFLSESRISFSESLDGFEITGKNLIIIPVPLSSFAEDTEDGECARMQVFSANSREIKRLYIYEDRWRSDRWHMEWKILGSVGQAKSVFARKCRVLSNFASGAENRISKEKVEDFLARHHSYGYVKSPYCIALSYNGSIVAAATFSRPKIFEKAPAQDTACKDAPGGNSETSKAGKRQITISYEWTRYASLPDIRVCGGMGKVLGYFAEFCLTEHQAEAGTTLQIMSYSDNETGDGTAYRKLGFSETGTKAPIRYRVDKRSFKRLSANEFARLKESQGRGADYFEIHNLGSRKFVKEYRNIPKDDFL